MSTLRSQYGNGEYQPYEPFTATLKAGPSYNDPWIIVKADTANQLRQRLNELELESALQAVARLSQSLSVAYEHEKNRER